MVYQTTNSWFYAIASWLSRLEVGWWSQHLLFSWQIMIPPKTLHCVVLKTTKSLVETKKLFSAFKKSQWKSVFCFCGQTKTNGQKSASDFVKTKLFQKQHKEINKMNQKKKLIFLATNIPTSCDLAFGTNVFFPEMNKNSCLFFNVFSFFLRSKSCFVFSKRKKQRYFVTKRKYSSD